MTDASSTQPVERLFPFVLHHQGFDHRVLVHAKIARRGGRPAVFFVPIRVFGERDLVRFQRVNRGR